MSDAIESIAILVLLVSSIATGLTILALRRRVRQLERIVRRQRDVTIDGNTYGFSPWVPAADRDKFIADIRAHHACHHDDAGKERTPAEEKRGGYRSGATPADKLKPPPQGVKPAHHPGKER